jgi:hypothetical protein
MALQLQGSCGYFAATNFLTHLIFNLLIRTVPKYAAFLVSYLPVFYPLVESLYIHPLLLVMLFFPSALRVCQS